MERHNHFLIILPWRHRNQNQPQANKRIIFRLSKGNRYSSFDLTIKWLLRYYQNYRHEPFNQDDIERHNENNSEIVPNIQSSELIVDPNVKIKEEPLSNETKSSFDEGDPQSDPSNIKLKKEPLSTVTKSSFDDNDPQFDPSNMVKQENWLSADITVFDPNITIKKERCSQNKSSNSSVSKILWNH